MLIPGYECRCGGKAQTIGLCPPPSKSSYTYGDASLAQAPYTMSDLEALQKTMLFGEEDVQALRQSKDILADQTDAILDTADARFDQDWLNLAI